MEAQSFAKSIVSKSPSYGDNLFKGFDKEIGAALDWFLWCEPTAGSSNQVLLKGDAALTKLFAKCKAKVARTHEDVEILSMFQWKLKEADKLLVCEWSKKFISQVVTATVTKAKKKATKAKKIEDLQKSDYEATTEIVTNLFA